MCERGHHLASVYERVRNLNGEEFERHSTGLKGLPPALATVAFTARRLWLQGAAATRALKGAQPLSPAIAAATAEQ